MIVCHHAERGPRRRFFALALLVGALLALAVPAFASAETFVVDSSADKSLSEGAECTTNPLAECTLRAAVETANGNADGDEITFGAPFTATPGTTITLGSTLSLSNPVEILGSVTGGVPDAKVVSAEPFSISTPGVVIEGLGIEASSIGVQILGGRGAVIRDNVISGVEGSNTQAGVEVNPGNGTAGSLIEGNLIEVPGNYSWGVAVQYGDNQIFGNEIVATGSGVNKGCCFQGVILEHEAAGNRIGGDTSGSENVITGFWYGAIWDKSGNRNEFGRNRGSITMANFIYEANSVGAPTISKAYPTKVSGTAEPEAKVRVFATVGEYNGEIEGFLGEVTAAEDGTWTAPITSSAVGAHVTATQTVDGGTSVMSVVAAIETEPSSGGGEVSGGGSSGGATTTTTTPPPATSITAPAPVKPTVKITKGPKKTSTATTAKFTFKAMNISGAKFECKLDSAKWASCKSPKTYKKLKPKTHTFQVRAKANGLTGAPAKFKFTVKP